MSVRLIVRSARGVNFLPTRHRSKGQNYARRKLDNFGGRSDQKFDELCKIVVIIVIMSEDKGQHNCRGALPQLKLTLQSNFKKEKSKLFTLPPLLSASRLFHGLFFR